MLTKDEKKAKNRAWQAASRARKKAAKVQAENATAVADTEASTGPSVQIDIPEEGPKLSLKERLMQKIGGTDQHKPVTLPTAKGKRSSNNLITTVLPTLLSGFLTTYTRNMLPDVYKACAPSKEEVSSIIGPLMDILARRVQVYGKGSPDITDLLNSLIASLAYGTRAYITYSQIRERESQFNGHEHSTSSESGQVGPSANGSGRGHGNEQTASTRHLRVVHSESETPPYGYVNGTSALNGDTESREYALSILAKARSKDTQYRREHGLN